jgi:imidazole glycerol-phosphate synthase subunit HisH
MIGIVNYGAGNLFSLQTALERLNLPYAMLNQPEDFAAVSHVIIPGVGHAQQAMQNLQKSGLIPCILAEKKPVLGICLGMQMLTASSEEGQTELLNIVPLPTKEFDKNLGIKIPHMGWNSVNFKADSPLFAGISQAAYFYFVHSFYAQKSEAYTLATSDYGLEFSCALQNGNFYGVQFHPEKSGEVGEQLLKNFAAIAI